MISFISILFLNGSSERLGLRGDSKSVSIIFNFENLSCIYPQNKI